MSSPFNDELGRLRRTLPRGSSFDYDLDPHGHLYMRALAIPRSARGVGSAFMTALVALCDENEVNLSLHAHGRGIKGDPTTSDLVGWYARFGLEVFGEEEEGVFMQRAFVPLAPLMEVGAGVASSVLTPGLEAGGVAPVKTRKPGDM